MVVQAQELDAIFHALSNETRRSVLQRLVDTELTVSELAAPLDMSLAAASKHVQVLERAGVVRRTVTGRRHLMRLEPQPLIGADHWLRFYERTWQEQLSALDSMFRTDQE